MSCGECNVVSWYGLCFSVNGSVCFVCCVSDSVCELFAETIRNKFCCGCYFLLNIMGLFNVVGGALLDIPCMVSQNVCVLFL